MALSCAWLHSWAQQTHQVSIRNFSFDPPAIHIRVGDVVQWINNEKRANHSILFAGANSLESDRLFPGESWQRVFDKPGKYLYT